MTGKFNNQGIPSKITTEDKSVMPSAVINMAIRNQ